MKKQLKKQHENKFYLIVSLASIRKIVKKPESDKLIKALKKLIKSGDAIKIVMPLGKDSDSKKLESQDREKFLPRFFVTVATIISIIKAFLK